MKKKCRRWVSLMVLLPAIILAQKKQDSIPGNRNLPSSVETLEKLAHFENKNFAYSVEDFFTNPSRSNFKLSPDGKKLSFKQRSKDGKIHIYIQNLKTNKITVAIEEKEQLIDGYFWASNDILLYFMDTGGDENHHLYSYNLITKKDMDLTPFPGVKALEYFKLKKMHDHVIITLNKRNKEVFEPYKINYRTGKMELIFENSDLEYPIISYKFSSNGVLRSYTAQRKGGKTVVYYKNIGRNDFHEVMATTWKNNFEILDFVSDQEDIAYVLSNLENDKNEIIMYDLRNNKVINQLFSNDTYDLAEMSLSNKRGNEISFYFYEGEKPTIVPVSTHYQKLYQKLKRKFPSTFFYVTSSTDDEDKHVITVFSDVQPRQEYLYNENKNTFRLIGESLPKIDPTKMGKTTYIKFTTRDGFVLYGYLTMPNNAVPGKPPLVVNPHGGPYNERDSWNFDPEAQLFASRGYAVLKINYRGSGGYGKKIYLAGNKQIGRKMLDDLEDGVNYVAELREIDESKIAIYGGSYGGLAALGSLMKSPDLYKCGVSYVGVSNFFTFVDSFPAYWKPAMKQFYEQWYDPEIAEEKEIMREVSPALNIEKLNKPIFIVQGANDPRVNINESDQVVKGLRDKGFDVPYMVKYNEGHGFHREENKIDMYKTMMGFFAKNLK